MDLVHKRGLETQIIIPFATAFTFVFFCCVLSVLLLSRLEYRKSYKGESRGFSIKHKDTIYSDVRHYLNL